MASLIMFNVSENVIQIDDDFFCKHILYNFGKNGVICKV